MNNRKYKYLEEKARLKGKKLLIEEHFLNINSKNIEVLDKPKMIESADKKSYIARAIIRSVPVSKFTENLNGRIYPRELDEKIIKEGVADGTLSLADHPEESDGSIKDIAGVWHNPRMDEDYSYGDWYLVGNHGQLILETIQAGGKVGVSRVGFGDFKEDGKTVDPESYELERWGDAVMIPSQGVYATAENISENAQILESLDSNFNERITNNNKEIIMEEQNNKKSEVQKMSNERITELAFRNQVNRAIKESLKAENISEAIEDLNSLIIPETMLEEQKAVRDAVSKLHEKLESSKQVLQEKVSKTEEGYKEIKDKYELQSKMLESMKAKFQKIEGVLKAQGLDSFKDIEVMKESIGDAIHDIKILKEEKTNLLTDMKVVMNERVDMLKDIKVFIKKQKMSEAEKAKLMAELKKLKKLLTYNESYTKQLEETLKKEGYKIVEKDAEEDEEKKADEKEDEKADEDKKESLKFKKSASNKIIKEEDDEDTEDEDEDEKEESYEIKKGDFSHLTEEDDEEDSDEDKDDGDDEDEPKNVDDKMAAVRAAKESKEEDVVRKQLKSFFKEQVISYPGLKDYENEIVNSKSFIEAMNKIEKIKGKRQEEQVKFSEAKLQKTWIPDGRI